MEEFWKTSDITGKKYNVFDIVKILNIKQAAYYSSVGVELLHIEISKDRKTNEPVYVFYFPRSETKSAYMEWCERKQKDE